MNLPSLAAAQAQPFHHVRAPRPQPQSDPTTTTQASDLQQQKALQAEQSVNLLV